MEVEVPLFPGTSERVVPPAVGGAPSEMQAVLQAMMAQSAGMMAQSAALTDFMTKAGKVEPAAKSDLHLRSTIQVKPTIRWPTLDDGD